jgi:hypothetical protein
VFLQQLDAEQFLPIPQSARAFEWCKPQHYQVLSRRPARTRSVESRRYAWIIPRGCIRVREYAMTLIGACGVRCLLLYTAVEAGRLAYLAGRMQKRRYADPSSPLAGLI